MINAHMKLRLEAKLKELSDAMILNIVKNMEDLDNYLKMNVAAYKAITLTADANWVVTVGIGNIDDRLPYGEINKCYYQIIVRHKESDIMWFEVDIRRDDALGAVKIDNKPKAMISNTPTHLEYIALNAAVSELITIMADFDFTSGTVLFTKRNPNAI